MKQGFPRRLAAQEALWFLREPAGLAAVSPAPAAGNSRIISD